MRIPQQLRKTRSISRVLEARSRPGAEMEWRDTYLSQAPPDERTRKASTRKQRNYFPCVSTVANTVMVGPVPRPSHRRPRHMRRTGLLRTLLLTMNFPRPSQIDSTGTGPLPQYLLHKQPHPCLCLSVQHRPVFAHLAFGWSMDQKQTCK